MKEKHKPVSQLRSWCRSSRTNALICISSSTRLWKSFLHALYLMNLMNEVPLVGVMEEAKLTHDLRKRWCGYSELYTLFSVRTQKAVIFYFCSSNELYFIHKIPLSFLCLGERQLRSQTTGSWCHRPDLGYWPAPKGCPRMALLSFGFCGQIMTLIHRTETARTKTCCRSISV